VKQKATKKAKTMSPAQFKIIYDGSALNNNEMNVNDLAPALLAIGDLMEAVGNALHGDKFKINVSVKGSFKTGCFGIEMIATTKSILLDAIDIFNHGNTTAVLNAAGLIGLIGGGRNTLIGFLRWLKNRKVTKKEVIDNGIVRVFVDDDHYEIEQIALELLQNHKIRKAFDDLINKPLSTEGIDSFAVINPENPTTPVVFIESNESTFFAAPAPSDEAINDQTTIVSLQIVSATFAENNKWRFFDGSQSFFAEVLDEAFLQRVQSSEESFAKSDILKVEMRVKQSITPSNMKIKTEYFIIEVIEHRSIHQIDLF
jgi:hypothetical protein